LPDGDQEEHETTEFSVKPSSGVGRHTSNGSVSRSTFVISEPSDKIIRLQESKLDVQDEAAAAQADAIFDREADAIVARAAAKLRADAKFRAEMTQLLSLSQKVAVA
jgi:hypothetical protein